MRRLPRVLFPLFLLAVIGETRAQANPNGALLSPSAPLPDSPGALQNQQKPRPDPRCPAGAVVTSNSDAMNREEALAPCAQLPNPYQLFLNTTAPLPLSVKQKGLLAVRDVIDPFNLLSIAGNSAVNVGIDAHAAYGPGMRGFARNLAYGLSQEATGEFVGTFLVCSLFHEDPHYHRLPDKKPLRRLVHAVSRTFVAQHDDGRLMPNYQNFITYPASAEISNLYVPGVHGNGPSTIARILTGLATDPITNLITEFLPDVARHVHIRVVFVQQIINQVASQRER